MKDKEPPQINISYLIILIATVALLPILSAVIEFLSRRDESFSASIFGKWFIFWAVGVRLLIAGIRQVTKPSFTAKEIFHISGEESYVVIKELGFANICAGIVGVVSLFHPSWRIVSAFASGLYFGLAAVQHVVKKSPSANETIAMLSDVFIFLCLACYVVFFL